ncbi:MAG TPA: hypothetical protein VLI54_05520 [Bacillota bacterium]|nr:hypothetical protein [Bacillota bacterium]
MFKKKPSAPVGRIRNASGTIRRNAAVFSYHAANNRPGPPISRNRSMQQAAADDNDSSGAAQTRHKQRTGLVKRIPRVSLVVLVLVLLVLNTLLLGGPRIVLVQSDDPAQLYLRSQDTYRIAIDAELARSVLNHAKFTINTKRVTKELQQQFPELADIRVQVPLVGTKPAVYIQPAIPVLLMAAADGRVYALDTTGRALVATAQAPSLARLHLPTVSDQSGLPVTLGRIALPGSSVSFITEVVGQLKAKQLSVTDMTLPKGTSELDVRISGVQYTAKFNLQGKARVEAGTFLAVKQQLDKDHITPGSYIDARVEGRAYYK